MLFCNVVCSIVSEKLISSQKYDITFPDDVQHMSTLQFITILLSVP